MAGVDIFCPQVQRKVLELPPFERVNNGQDICSPARLRFPFSFGALHSIIVLFVLGKHIPLSQMKVPRGVEDSAKA